ncbi:hypothetical protein FS837_001311 [Tulasnella sp. UAMH 9824]|nr:hypothetical protein FS837_001311 [Tulasnella sp. UAMH 9824]
MNNKDQYRRNNGTAYEYSVKLGRDDCDLESLSKLFFDLTEPTGANIGLLERHMYWLHWTAVCCEIDCQNRMVHEDEVLKRGMTSSEPDPPGVEKRNPFTERVIKVANYLIPELTRIVRECEVQSVEDSFKGDVDYSLRQARDAIEIFQRIRGESEASVRPGERQDT